MCARVTSTASGSAKVVTNDDRFSIGLASVQAKLVTIVCAARAAIPVAGNVSWGTGLLTSSNAVTFADAVSLCSDLRISSAPAIGNLLRRYDRCRTTAFTCPGTMIGNPGGYGMTKFAVPTT